MQNVFFIILFNFTKNSMEIIRDKEW